MATRSSAPAELAAKLRQLSKDLWKANTRDQAVDWMAKADALLMEAARQLEADRFT